MKLDYLMTYHADLKPPVDVGLCPLGVRQIYDVTGGTFEGPKLRGTILPSGGDWLRVGSDGVAHLDVRATFTTDDGAQIFVQYFGVADFAAATEKLARGEATEFGEIYFMTTPRFETGDARYAWLNGIAAVAEGRAGGEWVEYRVYQLVNGE
jgi:feruloyl esterase